MVSFDKWARSLTRALRGEQDGGLPGVEALTFPYSKGQFEVACKVAIESKVKKWVSKTMKAQPSDQLVEKAYCAGTTVASVAAKTKFQHILRGPFLRNFLIFYQVCIRR
jgi:hypothetical protein